MLQDDEDVDQTVQHEKTPPQGYITLILYQSHFIFKIANWKKFYN